MHHTIPKDISDRVLILRTINIPVGADVGDTFCTTISLSEDNVVEQPEETFSVSFVPPGTGVLAVDIPDTIKTITITDGDSKYGDGFENSTISTNATFISVVLMSMYGHVHCARAPLP